MLEFGAIPPEVNSGRIYAGAGSGPMMAAASAWDSMAAELSSAAGGYDSVIIELTTSRWLGPVSQAMLAAIAPYISWIAVAAAHAEQTAIQARAAAAAYETAFGMTVPPPVIAANRVLLMTLIATNFFGQNTPAIATTEAQYFEMWAQDAVMMYDYASSSAVATELNQFVSPPNSTAPDAAQKQAAAVVQATGTPAGNSAQNTATHLVFNSAVPQALRQLAAAPKASSDNFIWNTIRDFLMYGLPTPSNNYTGITTGGIGALRQTVVGLPYFSAGLANFNWSIGGQLFHGPAGSTAGSAGAFFANPAFTGLGSGGFAFHPLAPVAAHAASATKIGGLSVPHSWLNAPGVGAQGGDVRLVSATSSGSPVGPQSAVNPAFNGMVRGIPPVGGRAAQRAGNLGVRYGFRYSVLCRPPSAG